MKQRIVRMLIVLSVLGNVLGGLEYLTTDRVEYYGGGWVEIEGHVGLLGVRQIHYGPLGKKFGLKDELVACGEVERAKDGSQKFIYAHAPERSVPIDAQPAIRDKQ